MTAESRAGESPQKADLPDIWATTDFPYQCLRDRERTDAFRSAIREVVRSDHVVVDAGAGTGILSFFAAEAGAAMTHAIEIEPTLAGCIRRSIDANGFGDRMCVIEGDVRTVDLPREVDVVVAELIDTALIDEPQIDAYNLFLDRGMIGPATTVIPARYTTLVDLVSADNTFYGFRLFAPGHEWPFYDTQGDTWVPLPVTACTEPQEVVTCEFDGTPVDPEVDVSLTFDTAPGVRANALRLRGRIDLSPSVTVGATPALNGDKLIYLPEPVGPGPVRVRLAYRMSGGLSTVQIEAETA